MLRYRLADHRVPAMCLNLAAARLRADCPSGKAPTTRVRRRISRIRRSSGLLTGMMIAVSACLVGATAALAYGATIRDEGHREHVKVGRPFCTMS